MEITRSWSLITSWILFTCSRPKFSKRSTNHPNYSNSITIIPFQIIILPNNFFLTKFQITILNNTFCPQKKKKKKSSYPNSLDSKGEKGKKRPGSNFARRPVDGRTRWSGEEAEHRVESLLLGEKLISPCRGGRGRQREWRKFTEWFKRADTGIVKLRGPRRTIDPGAYRFSRRRGPLRASYKIEWFPLVPMQEDGIVARHICGGEGRVWEMEIKV